MSFNPSAACTRNLRFVCSLRGLEARCGPGGHQKEVVQLQGYSASSGLRILRIDYVMHWAVRRCTQDACWLTKLKLPSLSGTLGRPAMVHILGLLTCESCGGCPYIEGVEDKKHSSSVDLR